MGNPRTGSAMRLLVPCLIVLAGMLVDPPAGFGAFAKGEVFAGVGTGLIKRFSATGTLLQTLDTTSGCSEDLGMAFDLSGNLYSTAAFGTCGTGKVFKFDTNGTLIGPFGSGFSDSTESITLDATGNVYVGQPDGTTQILKFSPTGTPLGAFSPATENRGTDWIDLAADQCTMYYTSEGSKILRFNVCTNTQLPNFCTTCGGAVTLYAIRIRSNGEVLAADGDAQLIRRFDASGNQIQTYSAAGLSFPFAINLDPDGLSFWTGDYNTGHVFRMDLASGSVITQFDAGKVGCCLSGLAIFGEPVVGQPPSPPPGARVPTLGEWGFVIMAVILTTVGVVAVQRRQHA